jgi:hypothetical protein
VQPYTCTYLSVQLGIDASLADDASALSQQVVEAMHLAMSTQLLTNIWISNESAPQEQKYHQYEY